MVLQNLISWNDISYFLGQAWTNPDTAPQQEILSYDVYPDQLVITVQQDLAHDKAVTWLQTIFGNLYKDNSILLRSPGGSHNRSMPVEIVTEEDEERLDIKPAPRFSRMGLISAQQDKWEPPSFKKDDPKVFAFYSFKGGVGRTLSLIAFVKSISEQFPNKKLLIVDADLEAPGLTSLVSNDTHPMPSPSFSLTDLLALAHADPTEHQTETLQLAKSYIETAPIVFDAGDRQVEHYFLPAYREQWQQLYSGIRPEDLIRSEKNFWRFGELFAELGAALGVYGVVIDLRAGLSEMTSPLLFDPRCHRYLVSSCAKQSIDGIKLILEELHKLPITPHAEDLHDPKILLTFVTDHLENDDNSWLEEQEESLRDCYRPEPGDATPESLERLTLFRTPFESQLLNIRDWTQAISALEGTKTARSMRLIAEEFEQEKTITPSDNLNEQRKSLHETAKKLVYAETIEDMKFLRIPPLRNLARKFNNSIPIANVIGSKGSGKTFTSLILASAGTWEHFVKKTLETASEQQTKTPIWPLLYSGNLTNQPNDMIRNLKADTLQQLGEKAEPPTLSLLLDKIRGKLKNTDLDLADWREFWFDLIAEGLGIQTIGKDSDKIIIDQLSTRKQRLLVTIDGLEEVFDQADKNPNMRLALRALLESVPRRLQERPNCPLGVLIFVRSDLVRLVILQNVGQFEAQYDDFKLAWNRHECLKLGLWACRLSGCIPDDPPLDQIHLLSEKKIEEMLETIWGRKLGTERSNEAHTTRWIIAVLSDFRAQIQARDMVRLLMYASEASLDESYHGRLLVPNAIRTSIKKCSIDKVKEIRREFPELGSVFQKIDATDIEKRQSPFEPATFGFDDSEIKVMEDLGIVLKDKGLFYFPEIYLYGFEFVYSRRGRNRVLSLFRKIEK